MKNTIHHDAWQLESEQLNVLAAIASAKQATLQQIADAGIPVDQAQLTLYVDLNLIKTNDGKTYRTTQDGRSLLWHRKLNYSGYPMFAHNRVVQWALYLNEVFERIETFLLEMDLGMTEEELDPYLAKMADHSMIVRKGDTAFLLDRSQWVMDY